MSSFGRQFTASPVLTMSPQPAHQAPFGMVGFGHQQAPPASHTQAQAPPAFGAPPVAAAFMAQQPSKPASSGRKRSRDEAASNLEPDAPPPPPPQEPEDEWVYGEGMVLIKANKGYVADASSQSGTWMEEKKAAEEEVRRKLELEREIIAPRSCKLVRVDRGLDTQSAMTASAAPTAASTSPSSILPNGKQAPVIDDFTLHLGIGWRKISDAEHIQAAARGWARFIENHFPLNNVQIRLESSGLQSYLVESSEGFFLFAENLRHGRLVSTNVEGALRNLQTSPPTFDGACELSAAESPAPSVPQPEMAAPAPVDMEMHVD
jgi:hypothetical protein